MSDNKSLNEFKAIEAARKVYNDTLNGYSQRTALRRAFKKYEELRPKDEDASDGN